MHVVEKVFVNLLISAISKPTASDGYCQSGERLEQVVFSQTIKDRVLEGFIASSQSVSTDQECQMLCILDGMCNSYNLGDQDSSFRHSCQVLRYGVGNQTVKLRKGWSFRARKCLSSPCLNGTICFTADKNNTPQCACTHPVTSNRTCSQDL